MEVLNVDVLVGRRFALAPEEEALLGRHLLHWNVLDGKAQNDRPDHTQRHLGVSIHDFYQSEKQKQNKTKQIQPSFIEIQDRFNQQTKSLVN